ncbi:helix-turn-helix domain-containing protein [Micromonospora sp. NPDC049559]|uniref:helix-turn-helix domain-containing protein n=1 Tax=Micromonospora sp. NPDC049559 TaxID=3155923 RepID=UPI003446B039
MPDQPVPTIRDTETLRAIAHPIRAKLLALLRYEGPATASQLARRLDESSGTASYHLRQLARYGFVEEDPEQPNKRDRRWRAAHRITSWNRADLATDPEGRQISDALERRQLLTAVDHFQRWFAGRDHRDPRWDAVGGAFDDLLRLTPSQLRALDAELMAVFARFRTEPPAPEPDEPVGHVRVYTQLLPFEEVPL